MTHSPTSRQGPRPARSARGRYWGLTTASSVQAGGGQSQAGAKLCRGQRRPPCGGHTCAAPRHAGSAALGASAPPPSPPCPGQRGSGLSCLLNSTLCSSFLKRENRASLSGRRGAGCPVLTSGCRVGAWRECSSPATTAAGLNLKLRGVQERRAPRSWGQPGEPAAGEQQGRGTAHTGHRPAHLQPHGPRTPHPRSSHRARPRGLKTCWPLGRPYPWLPGVCREEVTPRPPRAAQNTALPHTPHTGASAAQ